MSSFDPFNGQLFRDGSWIQHLDRKAVTNAYSGLQVGTIAEAGPTEAARSVEAAVKSLSIPFPAHERYRVLMEAARALENATEEIARLIASEGSKTLREARREPPRAADILRLSADESRRLTGETLPFDIKPGSERRIGYWQRRPAGVVAAILPFNDPLAVAAHKVGPALAAGNAVVVKPDSRSALSVLFLAEVLRRSGLPNGRINVVSGAGATVGHALVTDSRVRVVSFTGGSATGQKIAETAGVKKLILELGANSAVIVLDDADLDAAADAIVAGAFAQGGQNCLGVQRVLAQTSVYESLKARIVQRTARLHVGDSMDDKTDVVALITEKEAIRVESWISEALADGAVCLNGGHRSGAAVEPTVLEHLPEGCRLDCNEVYGPVLGLYSIASLDEAVERVNSVPFGLHAAVFTESLSLAMEAAERLDVGAVIINDSTDYRLDTMPFGGVKGSGLGREGVRFAVESMTEPRVVCINR